jgi:hypothetical protein
MADITVCHSTPRWVEAPPSEPGSIDPLGYRAQADRIAEGMLPGLTIATTRARYLSFLCWAKQECDGRETEIDRWEVAMAVGEWRRHKANHTHSYLGSQTLDRLQLASGDAVPRRLNQQTARVIYAGLLPSCGLEDDNGKLTERGLRLAAEYGKAVPVSSCPRIVWRCDQMPCLGKIRSREREYLEYALSSREHGKKLRRSGRMTR